MVFRRAGPTFILSMLIFGAAGAECGIAKPPVVQRGKVQMEQVAEGSFKVKLAPISAVDAAVGAMSIDKVFTGALAAKSVGQMLAVGTGVEGSAGYVAMERVTGTLNGHPGSFALQHSGTMRRGEPSLTVTVVPDSGTGRLTGLSGTMEIVVEGGKHEYRFRYSLAN